MKPHCLLGKKSALEFLAKGVQPILDKTKRLRIKPPKFILVLVPLVIFRFCAGSCPEPEEVRFNYVSIETEVPEAAFPGEIMIQVQLADTSQMFFPFSDRLGQLGFTSANAMTCDDPFYYVPNHLVSNITVETLKEITAVIPAGSEVGVNFYGRGRGWLYLPLDEFINSQVNHSSFRSPANNFTIYFRNQVENYNARFVVRVHFSDGTTLADTTEVISIL